jgi:AraC family transcriptional regulator
MHRLVGVFHGARLKHRELDGFTCSENIYPPNLRLVSHRHERPYYSLVLAGSYTERYGTKTRDCNRLSASLHPPEEMHSDCFSGAGGRLLSVEFKPVLLGRIADFGIRLRDPLDFKGGLPIQLGFRLYREFQKEDGPSQLSLEGVTLELLAEISRLKFRNSMVPPVWLRRAEDILHATFSCPPSLFDLASATGVHPVHLAREFRRHFSCTAGEYVRRLRVDFACRALLQTDTALIEIAMKAGFSDQSHFTRTFRAAMGLPPAQFRKHYRRKSRYTSLRAFKTSRTPS